MKKAVICIIISVILFAVQGSVFAAQSSLKMTYDGKTVNYTGITYKITINNKEIKTDFPGIVFNKVTMVPVRAVFEQLGGNVTWISKTQQMDVTYNDMKLSFKNNSSSASINGKAVKLSTPAKKINDRLILPVDFMKNIQDMTVSTDSKTKIINLSVVGSVKNISAITANGKDVITMEINNFSGYEVQRLTNPNRIVVDFSNVKSSNDEKSIATNCSFITDIRVAQFDQGKTRIVLDMQDMNNFTVSNSANGCKITVEKPLNPEFVYVNTQDRVYLGIKNIKLASVGSTITNYFTDEYDLENHKYIMTIPASSAISLAEDVFNIDDARISTIEIYREKETSDTKIVFNTKGEYKFFTSYNDKYNRSEINILTPAKEGETLVVIDAGHGGGDPGAVAGKSSEKDINLAIALELEKLLKEQGIKTFMLRQDDTFVGLYDRPYIANELNATLFLSIHNNSIDNKKISGTETLYFPEKAGDVLFTGQKFAQIIQDSLIGSLNSVNRKTVSRPNLVVLRYTNMPSSLAEIGFLTNANELAKLNSDDYRKKTAGALCNAIVESLKRIEAERQPVKETEADVNNNAQQELQADAGQTQTVVNTVD